MKYIKPFKLYGVYERSDIHIYYQDILDKIYNNDIKRIYTYLHTTKEKEVCEKILKEGFEFYEFTKTVDEISNNFDIFSYKLGIRKHYGKYTIVIQSLNQIVDGEDITIKEPFISEEGDITFTLSPKHVRGYFNNENGEFVENPKFELS